MNIQVRIKTPSGQATKTNSKIKTFLVGRKTGIKQFNTIINKEDSVIDWFIEADIKKCLKISKNVDKFSFFMTSIFEKKMVKKAIKKNLGEEDQLQLKEMLLNHTEVMVIK